VGINTSISLGAVKEAEYVDKVQYARFLETATAVQGEDAKEKFEKACGKILKAKGDK
jgi:hypothetical protein